MNSGFLSGTVKPFKLLLNLYADGFKNMSTMSKRLWLIALIKLFIMFGVLKIFFFQDPLADYDTEQEKIEHISNELTNISR